MKVAICICTYRRPDGLSKLLDALQLLEFDGEVTVAVADNDAALEGMAVCKALPETYRWPVHTTTVEKQGISHSRNAAANLALQSKPDFIAFLDDDEWPEPHWLSELLRVQQATGADAVGGPTISVFPENTPEHARNNSYYGADLGIADGSACQLEAAGNFLIKTDALAPLAPDYFHPDFALSGGEDLAFFLKLSSLGTSMHWAAEAKVNESVPEDRLSLDWLKQRVIVIANSRVRVMRMEQPGLSATLVRCIKTCGLCAYASLLSVIGLVNSDVKAEARLLRWKFWGKFTAHLKMDISRAEGR